MCGLVSRFVPGKEKCLADQSVVADLSTPKMSNSTANEQAADFVRWAVLHGEKRERYCAFWQGNEERMKCLLEKSVGATPGTLPQQSVQNQLLVEADVHQPDQGQHKAQNQLQDETRTRSSDESLKDDSTTHSAKCEKTSTSKRPEAELEERLSVDSAGQARKGCAKKKSEPAMAFRHGKKCERKGAAAPRSRGSQNLCFAGKAGSKKTERAGETDRKKSVGGNGDKCHKYKKGGKPRQQKTSGSFSSKAIKKNVKTQGVSRLPSGTNSSIPHLGSASKTTTSTTPKVVATGSRRCDVEASSPPNKKTTSAKSRGVATGSKGCDVEASNPSTCNSSTPGKKRRVPIDKAVSKSAKFFKFDNKNPWLALTGEKPCQSERRRKFEEEIEVRRTEKRAKGISQDIFHLSLYNARHEKFPNHWWG